MSIYLDYNATTPLACEVIEAVQDSLVNAWGNPSSSYNAGLRAKDVIKEARHNVAFCINAPDTDIVFTSGGSEANNWVINAAMHQFLSTFGSNFASLPHVITSTVEHDSILAPLESLLSEERIELTKVPINEKSYEVSVESIQDAIQPNTCLVSIMMANNETGTIMPIKEIAGAIRSQEKKFKRKILFHTDAAQTIGKLPVNVEELDVDFLSIVGHKFYGPRIGALYIKDLKSRKNEVRPFIFGGGQEMGLRSGTENTPMIAGLGAAANLITKNLKEYSKTMKDTRNYLEKRLLEELGEKKVSFNCATANRLPNTCNVSFLGEDLEGYKILQKTKLFSCSTGSACHSDKCKPSKILIRFHILHEVAANAIRISTGRSTSKDDIDTVVEELIRLVC